MLKEKERHTQKNCAAKKNGVKLAVVKWSS